METTAGPTTLDSQILTKSDQLDGHLLLPGHDR
jgi:hypothetical protein